MLLGAAPVKGAEGAAAGSAHQPGLEGGFGEQCHWDLCLVWDFT